MQYSLVPVLLLYSTGIAMNLELGTVYYSLSISSWVQSSPSVPDLATEILSPYDDGIQGNPVGLLQVCIV